MAIDITQEELIPFSDVPSILPKRRGKKINVSSIYRWHQCGLKGVRLEAIQFGGTKATTREALSRFFNTLTNAEHPTSKSSTPAKRRREIDAAERELDEAGI